MASKFHDLLAERSYLVADGATGTNLFGRGLETGYPPELWNVERPGTPELMASYALFAREIGRAHV